MQTPQPTTQPSPWSTHASYLLTKHFGHFYGINDRDRYHPATIDARMHAYQLIDEPAPFAALTLTAGAVGMEIKMSASSARRLARMLLDGADILEAFESRHDQMPAAEVERIDLPGGVIAFEPVAAHGGAA